ncbi:MAG: lipocalin family protein [Pseudomonadota bacterium]
MAGARGPWLFFVFSAVTVAILVFVAAYLTWRSNVSTPTSGFDPTVFLEEGEAEFAAPDRERPLAFPEDHGAHGQTRGEMWRFVGMVRDREEKPFGFQLTFYRLNLRTRALARVSAWAANQIFRAHFAITPSDGDDFHSFERFSRGALGLAGFHTGDARVWVENWFMAAAHGSRGVSDLKIEAREGGMGMALTLKPSKQVVETGGAGPVRFYAMSRLEVKGRLDLAGNSIEVSGDGYFEHAWGNLPPSGGAVAWNRYVIQLDDGRELILAQARRRDGSGTPIGSGVLIAKDGSFSSVNHRNLELAPNAAWRSSDTGVSYPSGWRVAVAKSRLDLVLEPLVRDQEVSHSIRYWSGAMIVSGESGGKPVSGFGYAELTGY